MTRTTMALQALFPPVRIGLKIWTSTLLVGVYGILAYYCLKKDLLPLVDSGAESTVFSGLVLGFLISFRNNTAYDRWWEARKLWGQLINEIRNLCIKLKELHEVPAEDRDEIGSILASFGNELKVHLRRGEPTRAPVSNRGVVGGSLAAGISSHRPIQLAEDLYRIIGRWRREGRVCARWGRASRRKPSGKRRKARARLLPQLGAGRASPLRR